MTKKKNQKANGKQQQPKPKNKVRNHGGVDPCTYKYTAAKMDPFNHHAFGACIPQGDGGRTFKFSTRLIASVQAITAGDALLFIISPSAASDVPSVQYHSNAAALTTTLNAITWGPNNLTATGSMFTNSDFGSGALEQRLVGCGVRLYNTTSRFAAAGDVTGHTVVNAGGILDGTKTATDYYPFINTRYRTAASAGNNPLELTYTIDQYTDETTWRNTSMAYDTVTSNYTGGTRVGSAFVGIQGVAGEKVSVRLELICHWEARGRSVTLAGTVNKPQPENAAKAFAATTAAARSAGPELTLGETILNEALRFGFGKIGLSAPSVKDLRTQFFDAKEAWADAMFF